MLWLWFSGHDVIPWCKNIRIPLHDIPVMDSNNPSQTEHKNPPPELRTTLKTNWSFMFTQLKRFSFFMSSCSFDSNSSSWSGVCTSKAPSGWDWPTYFNRLGHGKKLAMEANLGKPCIACNCNVCWTHIMIYYECMVVWGLCVRC